MSRVPRRGPSIVLAVLCASLLAVPAAGFAQTVVAPADLAGWLIGPFPLGADVDAGFETGPATPPFGTGSYFTSIPDPGEKIILLRNDYHDLPLSGLTALSYWTWIDPAATNTNNWYVNLYVDANGDGSSETRLDYVPPSGVVMTGVWQQWDAFTGTWNVNTGGTSTLADFLAANPTARINAFDTPDGGAIRFNMGDTASSYVGFDGNLDGIRIAHDAVGDTTWDFEVELPMADLFITKTASADTFPATGTLVYTIAVENLGPADATDVVVTDMLPTGLTLVETVGCGEDPLGVPTCSLGDLAAGDLASYTIEVTGDPASLPATFNTATVTAAEADPNADNDTDVARVGATPVAEIPTAGSVGLGLLTLLLAGLGWGLIQGRLG